MENQLVESVTKFTYLCSDVVSDSSSTPEVHRRIGLANSTVGQLDRVWRNRRLSLNTKLRLYTSLVQSVLLHESETQWRSERGAGGAVHTGRHLPGTTNGQKIVFKKKYTHANSDYLFLLAYEEQKN